MFADLLKYGATYAYKKYGKKCCEQESEVFHAKWVRCIDLYAQRNMINNQRAMDRELSDVAMDAFYTKLTSHPTTPSKLTEVELLRNKVKALEAEIKILQAKKDKAVARWNDGGRLWLLPDGSNRELILFDQQPQTITSNGRVGRMETSRPLFGLVADDKPARMSYIIEILDDATNTYKIL